MPAPDPIETFTLARFTLEVVNDPARSLPAARKQDLIDQCIPVARRAFDNPGVTESDIIKHAIEVPSAVFVSEGGRVVAFTSAVRDRVRDRTVVYLEGTAVLPEYKGGGLYNLLIPLRILHAVRGHDPAGWLLSTRTQNPVVFLNMTHPRKYHIHPRLTEPVPDEMRQLARQFAEVVSQKYSEFSPKGGVRFDTETLVVRMAYGSVDPLTGREVGFCMYRDQVPYCDESADNAEEAEQRRRVNTFFRDRSKIDLAGGDAVLLMGPLKPQVARAELDKALNRLNPGDAAANDLLKRAFP